MSNSFYRDYDIIWANLDPNGHMRHTAYMDYGAQVRLAYLQDNGFTLAEFQKLMVGPVLFRECTDYLQEVRAGQTIRVHLELSGISENRKHWAMRHVIYRLKDGQPADKPADKPAAIIDVRGAWFSLTERKVIPAPEMLEKIVKDIPRTEDFAMIESKK